MENTQLVAETADIESTAVREFIAPRRSPTRAIWEKRLRRAALAVIVLLLAWLSLTIRSSVLEIDKEMQILNAKMVTETH